MSSYARKRERRHEQDDPGIISFQPPNARLTSYCVYYSRISPRCSPTTKIEIFLFSPKSNTETDPLSPLTCLPSLPPAPPSLSRLPLLCSFFPSFLHSFLPSFLPFSLLSSLPCSLVCSLAVFLGARCPVGGELPCGCFITTGRSRFGCRRFPHV